MLQRFPPMRETLAPALVALASFGSILPYYLWSFPQATFLAVAIASCVAFALCLPKVLREKRPLLDTLGAAGLIAFLFYICIIPTLEGGHLKMFVFIPSVAALWALSDSQRAIAIRLFSTIFAVSVLPGLVVWLLLAAGVPLVLGSVPTANDTMAAHGVRLLTHPVVFFLDGNMITLPNGGVLFRFAGLFDEPGTVGTLGALLLAADGFRLSTWKEKTILLAGLASFSFAFLVILSLGLVYRILVQRSFLALALFLPAALVAALTLGLVSVPTAPSGASTHVSVAASGGAPEPLVSSGSELRQTSVIDNRVLPSMQQLISEWATSGWSGWAVGIGSDASSVKAPVSQTWLRIFTDYGVIGFVLVVASAAAVSIGALRRSTTPAFTVLFYVLFVASAYQRPTIWLPYALLLLFCAPFLIREYHRGDAAS